MHQPPPFVLPPDGWRARARGLLAGLGLQRRAIGLLVLAALALAAVVWLRGIPRGEPAAWSPPDGTAGAGVPSDGALSDGRRAGSRSDGQAAAAAAAGADGQPAGGPGGEPGDGSAAGGSGSGSGTGSGSGSGRIAVHVAGRVRHPGLVFLPAGSRVADAIAAAGGAVGGADLDRVNLARKLADGEQVLVLREGEPAPPPAAVPGSAPDPAAPGTPAAKLDLNTATAEQLETLPGVGTVTAGRIVAYRARRPFRSVQDLLQIEGIGERRFESLRNLVTVG
jgi:competence protein ComEA